MRASSRRVGFHEVNSVLSITVATHGVTSNLCSASSSRRSQEVKRVNRQQRQAMERHVILTLGVQAFRAIAALLMMARCLAAAGERISSLTTADAEGDRRAGPGPGSHPESETDPEEAAWCLAGSHEFE